MLLDTIKARIKQAMLDKNFAERDILRVVLGEAQLADARKLPQHLTTDANFGLTDDQVVRIVRKLIEGNSETIKLSKDAAKSAILAKENTILESLLPKQTTAQEIEAFFLNSNNPEFEQLQNAKSDGQATGIAIKALKAAGLSADGKVVGEVVKKIREQ